MKDYLKILAGVAAATLIAAGCTPLTYAQSGYGDNYNNNYNNGYDNGYNDNGYDNNGYDYNNGYANNDPNGYDYGQQGEPQITFNDFYNQLSPYGNWVNDPAYGNIWIAHVSGFQPYSTNGYWAYTSYGWTWVSNYNWGWGPFHYGRWGHSPRYGWFWVPGYTWGPAWVSWSTGADMYGWAPLGPGMSLGINISIGSFPANYWTFMPRRYMGAHNIYNYYAPRSRNTTIIQNTTIINNYGNVRNQRYSMGPQVREVERSTGRNIQPMRMQNVTSSRSAGVSNNVMRVYRPSVRGTVNERNNTPQRNTYTPSRGNAVTPSTNNNREYNAPQRNNTPQRNNYNPGNNNNQVPPANRESNQERAQQPVQRYTPQRQQEAAPNYSRPPQREQQAPERRSYTPPARTAPERASAPTRRAERSEARVERRAERSERGR